MGVCKDIKKTGQILNFCVICLQSLLEAGVACDMPAQVTCQLRDDSVRILNDESNSPQQKIINRQRVYKLHSTGACRQHYISINLHKHNIYINNFLVFMSFNFIFITYNLHLSTSTVGGDSNQLVVHKIRSLQQFVHCNFVRNSFLFNCGMLQSFYEGHPAWLPLLLNIVLLSQPCSNDITQESARVHASFQFCMAEPQHQSKLEDFSFPNLSKVLRDVYYIFLSWWQKINGGGRKWSLHYYTSVLDYKQFILIFHSCMDCI